MMANQNVPGLNGYMSPNFVGCKVQTRGNFVGYEVKTR